MIITAFIVLAGISLRDLNTIAPLLTMFFMITYAMVNVVALIEQSLALPSYRPSLKIPLIVPLIGAFGSITVMFIMNAFVALVSLILIIAFYFYLVKKNIRSVAGDSRSGLFTALAEWSTKKTTELNPKREARSWRPDLLIPVLYPKDIRSSFKLIESIVYPKGSIKLVSILNEDENEQKRLAEFLPTVASKFREIGIPISNTTVDNYNFNNSLSVTMQALNAAFFKPNTIFTTIETTNPAIEQYDTLLQDAIKNHYGLLYYIPFGTASLAIEKNISLWVVDLPKTWDTSYNLGNNDLAILLSIIISKNWIGTINVNMISTDNSVQESDTSLFKDMVRFPAETTVSLLKGSVKDLIPTEKNSDLNIITIPSELSTQEMIEIVNRSRISCLFCYDSGYENALV